MHRAVFVAVLITRRAELPGTLKLARGEILPGSPPQGGAVPPRLNLGGGGYSLISCEGAGIYNAVRSCGEVNLGWAALVWVRRRCLQGC